jgi:hypothetical protein
MKKISTQVTTQIRTNEARTDWPDWNGQFMNSLYVRQLAREAVNRLKLSLIEQIRRKKTVLGIRDRYDVRYMFKPCERGCLRRREWGKLYCTYCNYNR